MINLLAPLITLIFWHVKEKQFLRQIEYHRRYVMNTSLDTDCHRPGYQCPSPHFQVFYANYFPYPDLLVNAGSAK